MALASALQKHAGVSFPELSKDSGITATINLLTSMKETDIEPMVHGLSVEDVDLLVKVIYVVRFQLSVHVSHSVSLHIDYLFLYHSLQGFEQANNSPALLKWHKAAIAKGGHGAIMRTLTDRPAPATSSS